jgi:hypothetical protein
MTHLAPSRLRLALAALTMAATVVLSSGCMLRAGPAYGPGYNNGRGYHNEHHDNGRRGGGVVVVGGGNRGRGERHEERGTVRVR